MATVLHAAIDDTEAGDQTGPFLFGGFIAPFRDWYNWFVPAWEERILSKLPPGIPFHFTEINSPSARVKYGLTDREAERLLDDAALTIGSMGSLIPLTDYTEEFREHFKGLDVRRETPQFAEYRFEPDYPAFLRFVLAALEYASTLCDVEKVDFVIEEKTKITHRIKHDFFPEIPEQLKRIGMANLIPLLGKLIPDDKDRAQLQIADMGIWHLRMAMVGAPPSLFKSRYLDMFSGRTLRFTGMLGTGAAEFRTRAEQDPTLPKRETSSSGEAK